MKLTKYDENRYFKDTLERPVKIVSVFAGIATGYTVIHHLGERKWNTWDIDGQSLDYSKGLDLITGIYHIDLFFKNIGKYFE